MRRRKRLRASLSVETWDKSIPLGDECVFNALSREINVGVNKKS